MKRIEENLTTGNVFKKLVKLSIPLFFINLLQSFYNIVDMIVVGQVVGSTGVVAISNSSMICFVINSICIGITMGGSVLVSHYKGANDSCGQRETISTQFSIAIIISIIITVLGLYIYKPIFSLLNIPQEAMKDACDYMMVICLGTVFVFGYNSICSILRGFGETKQPLYFVLVATIINIFLDFLLVWYMDIGTKGAAIATVTSQGISFFIAVIYLHKHDFIFDFKLKSFSIKKNKLKMILKIGLPSAIQMSMVNISYLLVTGMLNNYGIAVSAASGIGLKINTFVGMPCWAVGQAVIIMVGQNVGARDFKRVEEVVKAGIKLSLAVTFISTVFVQIFAEPIVIFFGSKNQAVIREGIVYLRICCSINSLIYAVMYIYDSFVTGIGFTSLAMFNALLDSVFIRLFLSYILGTILEYGFIGVYFAQFLSPILPAIIGAIYFYKRKWKGITEHVTN
ncbi:MATE family efflux transporter [Clostridioides difficile]